MITNLVTVVPVVGADVLSYVWGAYYINDGTLHRVFAIHYLLPFVVAALVGGHLIALHNYGSGGASVLPVANVDADSFYLYVYKDILVAVIVVGTAGIASSTYPDTLHHPDNYVYVSRYNTPRHIVPE